MNWKKLLIIGVALTSTSSLWSNVCDPWDLCDGWSVHTDWLYWKTRKCDLIYSWDQIFDPITLESDTRPVGNGKKVKPEYESGVRIGLYKECNDWGFGVRYTHFCNDASDTSRDSSFTLGPTLLHPSRLAGALDFSEQDSVRFARSKYEVDLNIIDLEASKKWDVNCDGNASLFGGVKFAFIDQKRDTLYSRDTSPSSTSERSEVKEKIDMGAYGPYIGAKGRWEVCNGFGVFGSASVGTLLGCFDRSLKEEDLKDNRTDVDVDVDVHCIVNHFEFAAGVDCRVCDFCCADLTISVGYEFHNWTDIPAWIKLVDDGIDTTYAEQFGSLGFDGLFFRLNAAF